MLHLPPNATTLTGRRFGSAIAVLLLSAALVAPAVAATDPLGAVQVNAKAPTSVRIEFAGKAAPAVRQEIRAVSNEVCANAVDNGEMAFFDEAWCARQTNVRAQARYSTILRQYPAASQQAGLASVLVLAAR